MRLRSAAVRNGFFTLLKLTRELAAREVKTDVRAVWTFVHTEGLSLKKIRPAEQDVRRQVI